MKPIQLFQAVFYPFTAPNVKPLTKLRWTNITKIIAGISIITDIAHIPLQSETNSAVKSNNPIGKVFDTVVRVITLAIANSFHDVRKAKIPLAASPGNINGKFTFKNAPHLEQPSINAASFNSLGISPKNPVINHAVKGIFIAVYAIISPYTLSENPTLVNKKLIMGDLVLSQELLLLT